MSHRTHREPLPLIGLLAPSTTAFLTILTETMPTALMPAMAGALHQSAAGVGQLVSVYALASAAAAIPMVALTRTLPRRPLYIILVLSFAIANAITVAGDSGARRWYRLAGHLRLRDPSCPPDNIGRAVAITLGGSTVAMVAGLPLGTALGDLLGWRYSYGLLSLLALLVIAWVLLAVPPADGERAQARAAIREVVRTPGLRPILLATVCAILAHYTLYTYMAPLAKALGLPGGTGQGLLLFGAGALTGVLTAGRLIDTRLRPLAMAAQACKALMMVILWTSPLLTLACATLFAWGLSFGVMPTVFQSATGSVAAGNAELATAMPTTIYNLGIFGGGAVGGLLVSVSGVSSLEVFSLVCICLSLAVVAKSAHHAFPRRTISA